MEDEPQFHTGLSAARGDPLDCALVRLQSGTRSCFLYGSEPGWTGAPFPSPVCCGLQNVLIEGAAQVESISSGIALLNTSLPSCCRSGVVSHKTNAIQPFSHFLTWDLPHIPPWLSMTGRRQLSDNYQLSESQRDWLVRKPAMFPLRKASPLKGCSASFLSFKIC